MFKVNDNNQTHVINIENRDTQAYCLNVEEEYDGKPWYYDIKQYIKYKEYPEGASTNDKSTLSNGFLFEWWNTIQKELR